MLLNALIWLGRQGRYCLIAGLLVGLIAPDLAQILKPWVGTLVALLLFVTAIRIGAARAIGRLDEGLATLGRIALLQVALPLIMLLVLHGLNILDHPLALAVVLMLAAPSLTGAPNFAIMLGHDPAPGIRLLVLSTALFPLTALPVLYVVDPAGTGALGAIGLSLNLLAAILCAVGLGFGVRRLLPQLGKARAQAALDGCAALLLAIVVVGLMSAIGPLVRSDVAALLGWMAAAMIINIGLVASTLSVARRVPFKIPLATAIYAGNRNIALFLIVLPEAAAAPLMIFIGCYQVPMYLTPILLSRFQHRTAGT
ncbi:MAG: hypothetical protein AAGF36_01290 [Pseudomonadota bacterium]